MGLAMWCFVYRPSSSLSKDMLAGQVLASQIEEPDQPVVCGPAPLRRIVPVVQAQNYLTVSVLGGFVAARSIETQHYGIVLAGRTREDGHNAVATEGTICERPVSEQIIRIDA